MPHHRRSLLVPFLLLAATSCGEESSPTTDKDSARTGWRSTEVALAQAGVDIGWSGSGTVTPEGVEGHVTGTVACPDGGSMDVEAIGEVTDDMTNGALSIELHACAVDGVIIDGAIDYEGRVTPSEVRGSIKGELEWSGDAEGTCAIDIEATVDADGPNVGSYSVSGAMCGHDWSDVFAGA